jgi:hypothetical protein
MDKSLIERHLALAQRDVIEGEASIARQREIVFRLQLDELDCEEALHLLDGFIELQVMHVAEKERLQKELSAAL